MHTRLPDYQTRRAHVTSALGTVSVAVAALLWWGAAPASAQHRITNLGSPATRMTPPIASPAALRATFTLDRNRTGIETVLEKAGLAPLAPKVLAALTTGPVTDAPVAPGTAIEWMALRRAGKPDLVSNAVWAGRRAFPAYGFTVEDGATTYHFVVPKACGNLALLSREVKPLPECIHIALTRDCDRNEVTFTASGTAIETRQATRVVVLRDGSRVGELSATDGFKGVFPLRPGRYTFMATDTHGREFGTCERDYLVEACAAPVPPPPPPPPPPTSCGSLLTAEPVRGGWNLNVDGSASASGASPAVKAVVQVIGPDGAPVAFSYMGRSQSEAELSPPFRATFFVPRARPGTYTLRARVNAAQPSAEPRSCDSTVVVPEPE